MCYTAITHVHYLLYEQFPVCEPVYLSIVKCLNYVKLVYM